MSLPASHQLSVISRQKWFAVAACVFLTACGFQPMYGKNTGGKSTALAGVYIEKVSGEGRMAQQFRTDLEDKLNPGGKVPANPAYSLNVSLSSTESAIGVAKDGTISRYNLSLDSNYSLKEYGTDKVIANGTLRQVSSYNNLTNAYFSTYVSKEDAIKRGVTELSENYRQRLAPYLNGQRPPVKELSKEVNPHEAYLQDDRNLPARTW
ncbi:MAG: LPS assembly lipoprotein LptE [Alphaproteobacteria bacterium]